LQVLIASISHSGLVYIYIHIIFYRKITQWGHGFCGTFSNSLGIKVVKTYQKDCALYWNVYIICNVIILFDYCVTIKNELIGMFVSLGSKVVECFVLSERIGRVPVNSAKWHQVNAPYKFGISACNNCPSACNNWPSAWEFIYQICLIYHICLT
jgi:hypothetical protein